jgi:tetratricopeptide (TPR) repeat protein
MPLSSRSRRIVWVVVVVVATGVAAGGVWLWQRSTLPKPGSPRYEEYAEAFQVGVAALDVGVPTVAVSNLTRAIELIPEEPAAWANRGLLHIHGNQLDKAKADLDKARHLAPNDARIDILFGLLAEKGGKLEQAIPLLRKSVEQDPHDVVGRYRLSRLIIEAGMTDGDRENQKLLEQILEVEPNNLVALLERAHYAVHREDAETVRDSLERLERLSVSWPPDLRKDLANMKKLADAPLHADLPFLLGRFKNVLGREPSYLQTQYRLDPRNGENHPLGVSLHQFLRLQPLRPTPAPPDRAVAFTPEGIPNDRRTPESVGKRWDVALPVWLNETDPPAILLANSRQVVRAEGRGFALPFPSGEAGLAPSRHGVAPLDWNNDYRMDLLLAGAGGLRFFEQQPDGSFKDVNDRTKLAPAVLQGDYYGAWALDVDMDGDTDVVVAPRQGQPLLLRNNRDGTFTSTPIFPGVLALRDLAWSDLDNDGAPDAALLDAEGKLYVFANERGGRFVRLEGPDPGGKILALTAGDVNDDGVFDLAALRGDGVVLRISNRDKRQAWDIGEIARLDALPDNLGVGETTLAAADLDNNGSLDLLWMGPDQAVAWLCDGHAQFERLPASLKHKVFGLADFTGTGRLDLLALADDNIVRLVNNGSRPYHWQTVRAYAAKLNALADSRINSFAIGGEIEVRSGSLVVKQMINAPVVHFGLGDRQRADVIRIVWPNGKSQTEFASPPDKVISAEQRLTGSCPFLFTWDGERMVFVTDFLWSTPLGMYINAQDKGGFPQTTDWVKIRGDQLKPRDGYYDVRVNANLWETHYMDLLSLVVVDHPPGTEMHIDERFFLTPTKPEIHLTEKSHPVARAWDHEGRDATAEVREIDGVYLDRAGRGLFQGVTRDHWVEVDLGDDAPTEGPVYLLAHGFVHPTDSSINYALEKGGHDRPRGLVLEVPDGKGGWKVGRPALGFPAGKNKTVVIRLDGIEGKGVSRRFRLRTNMEIYWDALHYARGLDAGACVRTAPEMTHAELRFRGILEITLANASSPELPHYDRVISRGQSWRDLIGCYTRFGDVRELLTRVDDRYVIMNAGDEILLRFGEQPPPKAGWVRDFIWISDGWVKDGNLNTRFGKTVLPLPAHDMTGYDRPPQRLEDDPIYRRFPRDWEIYHTRYVMPAVFEQGLRSFQRDPGWRPSQ